MNEQEHHEAWSTLIQVTRRKWFRAISK